MYKLKKYLRFSESMEAHLHQLCSLWITSFLSTLQTWLQRFDCEHIESAQIYFHYLPLSAAFRLQNMTVLKELLDYADKSA